MTIFLRGGAIICCALGILALLSSVVSLVGAFNGHLQPVNLVELIFVWGYAVLCFVPIIMLRLIQKSKSPQVRYFIIGLIEFLVGGYFVWAIFYVV